MQEPERLKDFYARWFGFEELGRTPGGTVHITDGYFNMALMKFRPEIAEEDQRFRGKKEGVRKDFFKVGS